MMLTLQVQRAGWELMVIYASRTTSLTVKAIGFTNLKLFMLERTDQLQYVSFTFYIPLNYIISQC